MLLQFLTTVVARQNVVEYNGINHCIDFPKLSIMDRAITVLLAKWCKALELPTGYPVRQSLQSTGVRRFEGGFV